MSLVHLMSDTVWGAMLAFSSSLGNEQMVFLMKVGSSGTLVGLAHDRLAHG